MKHFPNKRGMLAVRADADGDAIKLVTEIKSLFEQFKIAQAETDKRIEASAKSLAEGASAEAKAAITAANAAAEKVNKLADRLVEAEQKLVDNVFNGKEKPQSLGVLVTKSEAYKQFASGATNKMRIEANTITGQDGVPAENSNILVPTMRVPGIVPGAFRSLRIRDLLPSGVTDSNLIEYTRELAFTNDAAETSEGELKPESDLTFELASSPVRTIAHWIKVTRQVMDDAPALASYIDNRLRYGVELRIDQQLLNGNGTNPNISGMTDAGNFTAFTPTAGDTALDSINRAKYQIFGADYAPTAIIMNPADWGAVERLKGTDDRYVVGDPLGMVGPVLWGVPVVVTNNMAAGDFLVAATDIAYQVWNRQGVTVEMTESNDTDFVKNLITIRAEARLALAVYRPASVRYGALTV